MFGYRRQILKSRTTEKSSTASGYAGGPTEAVAANVSDVGDASNSAWVDMAADANESNNGEFNFCGTMTSLSSVSFPLFVFS